MKKIDFRLWAARLLIAVVVAWNLQCVLVFMLNPRGFAQGFELPGIPGEAALRGFVVLFLMWNIPHLVALWQPRRNRLSLWEALAMQVVGGDRRKLFTVFGACRVSDPARFTRPIHHLRCCHSAGTDRGGATCS
jgi:hypothetical protein